MTGANIKIDPLSLRGASFADVDLTGSRIDGDLQLGQAKWKDPRFTTWRPDSKLLLEHVHVGFVKAALRAWPSRIQVDGFEFSGFAVPSPLAGLGMDQCFDNVAINSFGTWGSALEGYAAETIRHLLGGYESRKQRNPGPDTCYYSDWLRKARYTPSTVGRLQQILKTTGDVDRASEIAILAKNMERDVAWNDHRYLDWLGLALSGAFIGYGANPWLSGLWALAFIGIGAIVAKTTTSIGRTGASAVLFSFDLFLPVIQLRKENYDIEIKEHIQRWYFYLHRIMGYVLGLFLVGALTGLTK